MAFVRSSLKTGSSPVPSSYAYPTFDETVLAEDATGTGTLTFTDNISNYDLLRIYLVNSESGDQTGIITTPTLINTVFSQITDCVFNEYSNSQYATYKPTSATTWARQAYRNIYISKVVGLSCSNGTITETMIYNRGATTYEWETITGNNFLDYDMIFCASIYDGVQPNTVPIVKQFGESTDFVRRAVLTPYAHTYGMSITNTAFSSGLYYYVCGIKFTSSQPTPSAVKVLDNGEISTESSYTTANFTESIANYEYIVVIFRRYNHDVPTTADESHKVRGYVLKVSDIVDNGNTIGLYWDSDAYGSMNGFERSLSCTVTLTSITCYNYSGAYNRICCDVYAYPTGTLRYPD